MAAQPNQPRHTTMARLGPALAIALLASVTPVHAAAPYFIARRDYAGLSDGIAVADTNGDHTPDLITVGRGEAEVFLGNGNGTFRQGPTSQFGIGAVYPVARDLNGDGRVDLVLSGGNDFVYGIGVSLGNGDGTFQPVVFYQAGSDTSLGNAVLGDFNNDGIPDALVTGESGIWLFTGKGDGTFNAGVLTPLAGPNQQDGGL